MTPQEYLSGGRVFSVEEYLKDSPIMTAADYLATGPAQSVPNLPPEQGTSFFEGAANFATQFGLGAVETAAFGLPKRIPGWEYFDPQGVGESLGRGIGTLAGLAVGPLKVGGLAGRSLAPRIGEAIGGLGAGAKAAKFGANLAAHATPLAVAEGLVAAGGGEDIEGIKKAATAGALLGATFGVAQLINPQNKLIGILSRQLGGRALLAVTGQVEYTPEMLKQPNLAHTVWSELLNTWFLRNGISLEEVATGNFKDPKKKIMVEEITNATNDHNAKTEEAFRASGQYDVESMRKPKVMVLEPKDVYFDEAKLNAEAIKGYEKRLSKDLSLKNVQVFWNEEKGKYESDNNNLLAAYLGLAFEAKKQTGDSTPIKFEVQVAVDKGGKPPTLPTPAKVAMQYLGKLFGRNLTPEFVREADAGLKKNRYVIVDLRRMGGKAVNKKGGAVRVLPSSGQGEISLGPHQVLVEVDPNDVGRLVAGGSLASQYMNLPTAANRSRRLPLDKAVADVEAKIAELDNREAPAEDPEHAYALATANEKQALKNQLEQKQGEIKSKFGERIQEQEMLGSPGKFVTKSGMKFDASQAVKQAVKVISELRKFPLQEAPSAYVKGVEAELKRMGLDIPAKRFFKTIRAAGDDGKLVVSKMESIDRVMADLSVMDSPAEIIKYLSDIVLKDRDIKQAFKTNRLPQDLRDDQLLIEKNSRLRTKELWAKARKDAEEDPMGGSAIQRMLTITKERAMLDFRIAALDIEEKTGWPLYTIHNWLSGRRSEAYAEQKKYEERLLPFVRLSTKEQLLIREYYLSKVTEGDKWIDIINNRLSTEGKKAIVVFDGIFKDMEPDIVNHRFMTWYKANVIPKFEGLKTKEVQVFKNQSDPNVQALLEEGSLSYRLSKQTKDPSYYNEWIDVARAEGLGLIENGRYLPMEILGGKYGTLDRTELLWHIDAAGRGRFLSRGDIDGKDMDSMIEGLGREKNLILSVKNYVRQVLNVKYLDEGLQALNDLAEAFPEIKQARRKGFLRNIPESRAYTTEEYLKLYTMRLKGYPVKQSYLESLLKDTQLLFFRALVVRPLLWMRNMAQFLVNMPSKKFLDPRFTKFRFSKLPLKIQNWLVERGVDDSDAFAHTFLELETSLKINKNPILGKIWDFAGKFGKGYAVTDTWNRKGIYTMTWFRAKYYMDLYKTKQIDYEKLRNSLDLDKLKPRELLDIKEAITKGETDEGAFLLAKWMSDNSQWKYSRHERGLDEMTGGGEALSNLLTWSKSMVQHTYLMGQRFVDAAKTYKHSEDPYAKRAATRQMLHASSDVVGIMIAGAVTNGIYEAITVGHSGKYSPYGADMFTWQFGGVTGQILAEITGKSAALASSFDGTADEKKRALDDWIKMADKIGVRQMMPFMKQTLAVLESVTNRSFISPLYTLQSKFSSGYWRGLEKVDRTLLEGITHALFAVDPNKSEDVRKFTYNKLQELSQRAMNAKGPMKEWYELQVKRYEYLNDLFMRYQPVDVMRQAFEGQSGYDFEGRWKSKEYSREKSEYRMKYE